MIQFPTVEEFKKMNGKDKLLEKEMESILDLLLWSKVNLKSNFIFVSAMSDDAKKILKDKGYKIEKLKDQYKITY